MMVSRRKKARVKAAADSLARSWPDSRLADSACRRYLQHAATDPDVTCRPLPTHHVAQSHRIVPFLSIQPRSLGPAAHHATALRCPLTWNTTDHVGGEDA
ncbi:hypothetical protein LY76DRAFT_420565 [Colletotrichum caudatum]|nr:hypothetical protein LY76DRAFT_420565 [Colletotrichum caudatum]